MSQSTTDADDAPPRATESKAPAVIDQVASTPTSAVSASTSTFAPVDAPINPPVDPPVDAPIDPPAPVNSPVDAPAPVNRPAVPGSTAATKSWVRPCAAMIGS